MGNNQNANAQNKLPKEVESLLTSKDGQQVLAAIKNMDNANLSKLLGLAKNMDPQTIDSAMKNPDQLKKQLQTGELMAQLNKLLKG